MHIHVKYYLFFHFFFDIIIFNGTDILIKTIVREKLAIYDNYYQICEKYRFLRLKRYTEKNNFDCDIIAVINSNGATGSIKDGVAYGMLSYAKERGALAEKQPIIDYGGGSFSLALALAGKLQGHEVHIVLSSAVPKTRQVMLKDLGADLHFVPEGTMHLKMYRDTEVLSKTLGAYFVDYLNNDDNPEYHRRVTGPQIMKMTGENFDFFVAGVGSGGTISGTGEYIKAWTNGISIVGVQPMESQVLTGGLANKHGIEGIGLPIIPGNYNPYIVDEVISVTTSSAISVAREVMATVGVPVNLAGGAVIEAASVLARKEENKGKTILVMLSGRPVLH